MSTPGNGPFQPSEIVVVEASAGSGKTYALARRYVRLILHLARDPRKVPPIHAILAITFTNKAAFEMKERIVKFLKQLALGLMPEKERVAMLEGLDLTPDEVKERAGRVMEAILRGYNYFQVQTIDRFIRTLLTGSAFEIGLTAAFRIRSDDRAYLELALDQAIDEAAKDAGLRRDFEEFLTNMLLVEARAVWIPREVILDTMVKMAADRNSYGIDFVLPTVSPEDVWKLKARLVADVKEFFAEMPEGVNGTFAKGVRAFAERHRRAFRFHGLGASFTNETLKMNKGFVPTPEQADRWQAIHRMFRRVAELEMKHGCDPYIKLFGHVRERFDALCLKDDVVFLSQLNVRAGDLQAVAPLDMYYRLSTRFEHYLFDEFQDTSVLQWQNLKALPEDALANGGGLFYVGDKKQAIYSFRGGDTRLFDNLRREYEAAGYPVGGDPLKENRRSQPAVVAFNNAVFALENIKGMIRSAVNKDGKQLVPARPEDDAELERVYAGAGQQAVNEGAPGYVCVEDLAGANAEEAHDAAVARTVAILRSLEARGFRWKDVALLVRKNDEVARFTRALLENGIPASSERTLDIREHAHGQEMIAFLRFLESPVDDESFAAVVQGELFLRASGLTVTAVQQCILDWRRDRGAGSLYRAFSRTFPGAWASYLEPFFRQAGLIPAYELVSSIYRSWGALEHFPASRAFLMHLLGLVHAREAEDAGLAAFLDGYDHLSGDDPYVPADDANAVTVTTVHKSKGLDFNIVVLPFLAFNAQRDQGRGEKAVAYALRQTPEGLALYHFNREHTAYSQEAEEAYVEDQMRHFFGELNAVYVALTRACWEMYILLPPRSGGALNLATWLIPQGSRQVGEEGTAYPRKETQDTVAPTETLPPRCLDWMSFLHDEFDPAESAAVLQDRAFGIAAHAALEHIGVVMPGHEQQALRDALLFLPDDDKRAGVEKVLSAFLAEPAVKALFTPENGEVHTEFEVVNRFGDTRRIDRLLVGRDTVTVIDFKTSRALDPASAQRQMTEYKELAAALFPGKKVIGKWVFIHEKAVQDV